MAGGIGDILQSNIRQRFQPRQKLADALMQGAYDTSPVTSPWEALGRVLQGGLAGYAGRRVRDKETEAQKAATDTLSKALAGEQVDYNILGGNQDTAGLGLDLKVNDISQRREMENQRALAAARASERNKFFDVEGGQRDSDGRFYPAENKNEGLLQGTGFEQQAISYLVKGDPSTQEYAAIYNQLSSPRTQIVDGKEITIRPNMSAYRTPTFAGYGNQGVANPGQPPLQGGGQPTQPELGGQVIPPNGSNITVRDVAGINPKLTEAQAKARSFLALAMPAVEDMEKMMASGFSPDGVTTTLLDSGVGRFIGGLSSDIAPQTKQWQSNIGAINQVIQKTMTGAAATSPEIVDILRSFLINPGEPAASITRKMKGLKNFLNTQADIAGVSLDTMQNQGQQPAMPTQPGQNAPGRVRVYDPVTRTFKDE